MPMAGSSVFRSCTPPEEVHSVARGPEGCWVSPAAMRPSPLRPIGRLAVAPGRAGSSRMPAAMDQRKGRESEWPTTTEPSALIAAAALEKAPGRTPRSIGLGAQRIAWLANMKFTPSPARIEPSPERAAMEALGPSAPGYCEPVAAVHLKGTAPWWEAPKPAITNPSALSAVGHGSMTD